ncbi:MAG: methionine--tRNA ligase [Gammaproteobacteria bacterium]|nr:methionine--tRNA ligase [Gammaproteobacteria bacterium]
MRKILVTWALPYANGPLHLGHILEAIQADIWVRWQKLQGNSCIFVCGDDAHGTPIMLSAQKQGISPEDLVAKIKDQHANDYNDFIIGFDNFYTTHSPENRALATEIFLRLKQNDDIEVREIEQAYDPIAKMFLPDRFVKGTCPRCKAENQYGDSCEVCGATYSPIDLINPVSAISGSTPIQKTSVHYFFRLEKYADFLKKWAEGGALQAEILHKLNEWFVIGLMQWDISRDAPYFGFEIPDAPGKYFYVWLDAPIGYMASFKNFCERTGLDFNSYWQNESTTELYHFVGKDIIYFHALFWPAMLQAANFRKPTAIFTHGFLTINGQKMSKSRGTFITAKDYLSKLNPEHLRYYFAAKLNSSIEDLDLNIVDYTQRVNSDLVGKVINIASRCAKFINSNFAHKLSAELIAPEIFQEFADALPIIHTHYQNLNYHNAVRQIMQLADRANQFIDNKKPWALAKISATDPEVQKICTLGLNLFRQLMIYLKPILPKVTLEVEEFLNIGPLTLADINKPLLNHTINEFKPLLQRVAEDQAKLLITNTGV